MSASVLVLIPAYGRDYKNKAEVQAAWDEGRDFEVVSYGPNMGAKINKGDAQGQAVNIHYAKRRKAVVIDATTKESHT